MKIFRRTFHYLILLITIFTFPGCASQICQDPLGCIELAPGDPVEIGVLIPTTQLDRASGIEVLNGAVISLTDYQNLHGHPINLIKEDTSCLAVDFPRLIPRLTSRANLIGIIGPVCDAESDFLAAALSDAGKTIVSPTFIKISSSPGSLRTAPSIESQSDWIAEKILRLFPNPQILLFADSNLSIWFEGFKLALFTLDAQFKDVRLSDELNADLEKIVPSVSASDVLILILDDPFLIDPEILEKLSILTNRIIFTPTQFLPLSPPQGWKNWLWAGFLPPNNPEITTPISGYSYDAVLLMLNAVHQVAIKTMNGHLFIPRQKLRESFQTLDLSGLMADYVCSPLSGCTGQNAYFGFITQP